MRTKAWVVLVVAACSSSKNTPSSPQGSSDGSGSSAGSASPTSASGGTTYGAGSGFAQPPPIDTNGAGMDHVDPAGGAPGTVGANTIYRSDCSTTHPIARDVCQGAAIPNRGLKSCTTLGVKAKTPCKKGAPSCYVERKCPDGHMAVADFLECAAEQNRGCFTRSSRIYKEDITYLTDAELAGLATQIEDLRLARFRYKDTGDARVGFMIEDTPDAPWVTADGRRVDLYSLLSASIAAIQQQDARIRQLERDIEACKR